MRRVVAAVAAAVVLASPAAGAPGTAVAYVDTPVWAFGTADAVAVRPDGRVVVTGTGWQQVLVVQYGRDGRVDRTFGGGAVRTRPVPGTQVPGTGTAVAVQPDDRVVVAGHTDEGATGRVVVLRYRPDGSLDPSFGTGGRVLSRPGNGRARVADVAVAPDGRVVVAGSLSDGGAEQWLVQRYLPNGMPDATFGTGGTLLLGATKPGWGANVAAAAASPDGRITLAGNDSGDAVVVRLLPTGTPDVTYGIAGRATYPSSRGRVEDAAVAADGAVVAVRNADVSQDGMTAPRSELIRWTPTGLPDPAFGDGGVAPVAVGGPANGTTVATDAAGRYVVAGDTGFFEPDVVSFFARFLPTGQPDPAFGTGGVLRANLDAYESLRDVATTPGGIVAAGAVGETYYVREPAVVGLR